MRQDSGGPLDADAAAALSSSDAERLGDCLRDGGVVIFPVDTVYGLGCDPENRRAVERLYRLKGRSARRPAAVMFFELGQALKALPELVAAEQDVVRALLPGPVTLLLPNHDRRFGLACAGDPATLGLRVPLLEASLAALREVRRPIMQSSANLSGGLDARRLKDVPLSLRQGADLVLDGGDLPGVPSTVIDLREYAKHGHWSIVREGALARESVTHAMGGLGGS